MNLTDTWLRNNVGKQTYKEIPKSDGDGLEARLRNGKISFIYRPQLKDGTRIKMTIGRYPDMKLVEAREETKRYRSVVVAGGDPRKTKKAEIAKASKEPTPNEVFIYWHDNYCKYRREETETPLVNYRRQLREKSGNIYYKDLSWHKIVEHSMKRAKKSPAMESRVLGEIKQAIRYATDHDYL